MKNGSRRCPPSRSTASVNTILPPEIADLTPAEREILVLYEQEEAKRRQMAEGLAMSLADYVESTVNFKLDDWQRHLCGILETLAGSGALIIDDPYASPEEARSEIINEGVWNFWTDSVKPRLAAGGRIVLVHAPPQYGKTTIVSQRFPAWLLARKMAARIRLAMYGVQHATKHSRIVRDLMCEESYKRRFPDDGLRLPEVTAGDQWSTMARVKLADGQHSFKAVGLQSGLIGEGVGPHVIVMFHRYQENDLAGRILATEKDCELYRYAAVCDGDYQCPVTKRIFPDPLGRKVGEVLSPRFTGDFIHDQMAKQYTWLSQFQGRPTAQEGEMFKVAKIELVDSVPRKLRRCRAWDLAATKDGGDWTAGPLLGFDDTGDVYICDARLGQWGPEEVMENVMYCAKHDPAHTVIRLPVDPGQSSKYQQLAFQRMLVGFPLIIKSVSGSKAVRAFEFASAVNNGRVKMLKAPWNEYVLEQMRTFDGLGKGGNDDVVDGESDAFNELAAGTGVMTDESERPNVNTIPNWRAA